MNDLSPAQGHAIRHIIMNHQVSRELPPGIGFLSNNDSPSDSLEPGEPNPRPASRATAHVLALSYYGYPSKRVLSNKL